MANRIFTRVTSAILLVIGICAFIPQMSSGPKATDPADMFVGLHFENLFDNLPMNYLLGGIVAAFGVAGLVASGRLTWSRVYERVLFTSALIGMFLGLCPRPVSTGMGLLPMYGWTDGVFLIVALLTFYFAFVEGPILPVINRPVFRQ